MPAVFFTGNIKTPNSIYRFYVLVETSPFYLGPNEVRGGGGGNEENAMIFLIVL